MAKNIATATFVTALSLGLAVTGTTDARADSSPAIHGTVERLPSAPDLLGEWQVSGRTLTVDRQTRLESHVTPATGYWTQAATGVVLRAPGWRAEDARAAGFRPASADDMTAFRPGRVVKAHVAPAAGGQLQVTKIELDHERR